VERLRALTPKDGDVLVVRLLRLQLTSNISAFATEVIENIVEPLRDRGIWVYSLIVSQEITAATMPGEMLRKQGWTREEEVQARIDEAVREHLDAQRSWAQKDW